MNAAKVMFVSRYIPTFGRFLMTFIRYKFRNTFRIRYIQEEILYLYSYLKKKQNRRVIFMKLVYCIPTLYISGGMERVLTLKANYLATLPGYEITIVITDGGDKKPYFPLNPSIKVKQLDINFEEMYRYPFWRRFGLYRKKQNLYKQRLEAFLKEYKPDITISMLRREINFLNSLTDGSIKVGELHICKLYYRKVPGNYLPRWIGKWVEDYWMAQLVREMRKLYAFVVLTEEDKQMWTEVKNVCNIPNPAPFLPQVKSTCEAKRVIAVGRYFEQKGFDLLIPAWEKVVKIHPDWVLSIYGDGAMRPLLQNMVDERRLTNQCVLEEPVSNIEEKMQESSILVCSSRFEGWGMILVEAMACGVPVVSFACPCGPRDIISDGVDGLLVEKENIDELAEKICFLIEHEDERKRMGQEAAKSVQRYRMDAVGNQWHNLFEKLMKEKENEK